MRGVYVCVYAECAALCSRGRKSQDDGDFKTQLQLVRKPAIVCFCFPPFTLYIVSATSYWLFAALCLQMVTHCMRWSSGGTRGCCICMWSTLRAANNARFLKESCSGWLSSGGTRFMQRDCSGRGRASRSHKRGSGVEGGECQRRGGDSAGSGNSTLSDGCNWQNPEYRGMLGQQQTPKWKNTTTKTWGNVNEKG